MVRLTTEEIDWLRQRYPLLSYDEERSCITGPFSIDHKYGDLPRIKDTYNICVNLRAMLNRNSYPVVYETDGRIKKIAERKKLPMCDLHVYPNNILCLGLPERFHEYYPNGFTLDQFFINLSSHFYWVSYFDRYNKEPWKAELHGDDATIEYYIDHGDIARLRKIYKEKTRYGIAKSKLQNYLKSESLIRMFKNKLKGK
jgi:hypothetical protein